jgi:hypothetical protein
LKNAGCSHIRDAVDKRLIAYLKSLGKEGVIFKNEQDAGGQGEIKSGKLSKDSDNDGIPDKWERKHKLNPKNPQDQAAVSVSGYSNLEEYLNSII